MKLLHPRLQFSLRTLVIVMVIVAGIISWIGSRYARHQEQLKANAVKIETQAAFLDLIQLETSAGKRSTLETVEKFAFGDLGDPHADKLSFRTDSFDQKSINKSLRVAKLLHLFSEIESVTGYQRYPSPPLPNEFLDELLKLPKLKEVQIGNALIDDRAVNVLPDGAPLEKLHASTPQLTSAGVISLLQKAPKLKQLWLNEQALSPKVAGLLNQCIKQQTDSNAKLPLRVFSWTTDINLSPEVEQGLQLLSAPYELDLNHGPTNPCAHPYGVVLPGTSPKLYSGLRAQKLLAQVADRVTITNFDELVEADIHETTDFRLADCPRLEKLNLKLSHNLLLEKLPTLTQLKLQHCGKLQIQDCDELQTVDHNGIHFPNMSPVLILQRLPRLRSLECPGLDLTLVDVPALEQITLHNATPETLATIRELPNLQLLNLHFHDHSKELSADVLLSFCKLANLKRFTIHGVLPVPRELRASLLHELKQFANFRFSG